MDNLLPYITLGITIVLGIISFFIKRELDSKDTTINKLEYRVGVLEDRVQKQEVSQEKLSGRIDTIIEILTRVEAKLEEIT